MKINLTKIGNALSSFIEFLHGMTLIEFMVIGSIISILYTIAFGS